jgi:hypothetical protein
VSARFPIFRRLGALVALVAALALAACGDDDPAPDADAPGGWSDVAPAEGARSEGAAGTAVGSPDGEAAPTPGGVKSPEIVLERLRARVASGEGHSDPTFQREAEAVALVLWPEGEDAVGGAALQAARRHVEVAVIAGDVARWLTTTVARTEREASHPTDVAIHDAFLAAAARGPSAYTTWVEGPAADLLTAHREAVRRKMFEEK